MDNFRVTRGYGFKGFNKLKTKMDKGHKAQFTELIASVKQGGSVLIPMEGIGKYHAGEFCGGGEFEVGGLGGGVVQRDRGPLRHMFCGDIE